MRFHIFCALSSLSEKMRISISHSAGVHNTHITKTQVHKQTDGGRVGLLKMEQHMYS